MYQEAPPIKRSMLVWPVLVLTVISTLLLIAGFATPGWFIIDIFGRSTRIGLWYTVTCEADTCTTGAVTSCK